MAAKTDEDYDQLGRTLRESLGIDDQVYLDALEALKRMKHRGYLNDYIIVPDREMLDAEAKYVADERRIYIRASVFNGARQKHSRARFTIVHEISHCALNHQHERKRGIGVSPAEKKHVQDDERAADRLAAAILAPSHRIDFALDTKPEDISRIFGLSESMSKIRADELTGMFRRRHGIKRNLPPGVIDFLAEKRRDGHPVISLPQEDIVAMQVRQVRYEGDACPTCSEFKMLRIGTQLLCDACGTVTGEA